MIFSIRRLLIALDRRAADGTAANCVLSEDGVMF